MKKIIDANYFQDPELRAYLASAKENFVVFNDYACMEAYKGDSIISIAKSIEIVSNFPEQVIILKSTRDVVQLSLSLAGLQQLEDVGQTNQFRYFCLGVQLAKSGDESLKAQIIRKGLEASACFNKLRKDSEKGVEGITKLKKSFTLEQLTILRRREQISSEIASKITREILLLTAILFRDHPNIKRIPQSVLIRNSYIFRFAASAYLLALKWVSDGGARNVGLDKLCNDLVDMNYVAYGTYYDGLLTRDIKMKEIYQQVCFVLKNVFGAEIGMKGDASINAEQNEEGRD